MSDRTFYATDKNHFNVVTFNYQSGLSKGLIDFIKKECDYIFIDSMGNDAPEDWSYSNPEMKKWLVSEGINLPMYALSDKNNNLLYDTLWEALEPKHAVSQFSKSKCVYGKTKQFSETLSNSNKVVGQIMKTSSGKPLFQIIAVTDDMELAGKTKNALLKMGYDDSKEEVKTFAKENKTWLIKKNGRVLDIDGKWVDFRTTDPHDIEYFDDYNDAIKRAMEVEGTVEEIE